MTDVKITGDRRMRVNRGDTLTDRSPTFFHSLSVFKRSCNFYQEQPCGQNTTFPGVCTH